MPRKIIPLVNDRPYHISARCSNKEWFKIPIEDVWSIMNYYLRFLSNTYDVEILGFVLMNNHFHLLAMFPELNMSASMNYFMRETSRLINQSSNRINHAYKQRFFRSLINSNHYFDHVYKYTYRNPVEAGLCKNVEDYRFSTLHHLLGQSRGLIPVVDDTLFSNVNGTLSWLNQATNPEHREAIRKGLRRTEFSLAKINQRFGTHPLDTLIY